MARTVISNESVVNCSRSRLLSRWSSPVLGSRRSVVRRSWFGSWWFERRMLAVNGFELSVYSMRPFGPSSRSIASKRNIIDSFGFIVDLKN